MNAPRPSPALRVLPSFTDLAFLMPIVFLFGRMDGVKTLLSDCDTGWHIRTGEWIVANHGVPARDIFSFSKAGDPWFAWEWLSDVVFAWLNSIGGLRAVVLFSVVLLAVIFTLLYQLVRRRCNPIVAVVVTMLAAAGSSIHWLARPHLFTLLFLVLFYAALERVREGKERLWGIPYLAILPVVTVLWTNLHGGFFVGIVMIGAYGAAEVVSQLFLPVRRDWSAATRYFLSAAACLAASLLNPYTWRLHAHMAVYLRDPFNSQHIVEFLSPSFHHPAAIFFEGMIVLAALAAGWNISRGRFAEPLFLLVWAHAALLATRNIAIFMIAAAPAVAAALQEWLDQSPSWNAAAWVRAAAARFNTLESETNETEAVGRWHLVSVLGVVLVAAILWAPNPPRRFRAEFDPKTYPAAALAILRSDPSSRIFTQDEWGDYLIWRLYPSQRVFVDGRSDFYGDDFEEKYIDILNVRNGWEKTLAQFGVDTILMPPNTPLAGALKESSRWRVVYDDGVALVFRPSQTAAKTLSIALTSEGVSRDREVTKTKARDRAITETKTKT